MNWHPLGTIWHPLEGPGIYIYMCILISSFIHWPHHSQDDFFSPRLQLSISALSPWLFGRFGIRSFKRSHRWSLGRQDAVLWLSWLMGSCWAACYELKYKKPINTTNQINKWCSLTFITVTFLCYVRWKWMCIFFTSLTICCLLPGERELGDEFSGAVQRRLSAPYHLKAKGWIFHGWQLLLDSKLGNNGVKIWNPITAPLQTALTPIHLFWENASISLL